MDKYLDYVHQREGAEDKSNMSDITSKTQNQHRSSYISPLLVYEYDDTLRAEAIDFIRQFENTSLIFVANTFAVETVLWATHEQITDLVRLPTEQDYLKHLISSVENGLHTFRISLDLPEKMNHFPILLANAKQKHQTHPIKQSIKYIHHNLQKNILIQDLAKISNMSQSTFKRHFKRSIGVTCNDYMKILRFHISKQLLRHTQLQIGEIAHLTGFCDASHFGRLFKSMTDESPREYRSRINSPKLSSTLSC
jgi:AraC-like DNA-binding protein